LIFASINRLDAAQVWLVVLFLTISYVHTTKHETINRIDAKAKVRIE